MSKKDYYEVLGIARSATHDEVKAAFKKLAKQFHPDKNQGDKVAEERFKEISEAYEVIGDVEKRKKYDQYGHFDFGGGGPQDPFSQGFWQQGGFSQVDLEDIFGDILGFGGAKRGRRAGKVNFDFGGQQGRNGTDIHWTLPVEFLEAAHGVEKNILLSNGQKVKVKIPAGVDKGSKIRLAGKGNPGIAGGRPGDLIIETDVQRHPHFRRDGDDIHADINISVLEALQGGQIPVPTLSGDVSLKIPKGVNSGQKLRLKGKGIPNLKTKLLGNFVVHLNIVVPENLSAAEIESIKKILEKYPVKNRI